MSTDEVGAPMDDESNSEGAIPEERRRQISVVVLSKDEHDLAVTLELLRPQCEDLNAECIVVDASEHRLESIHQAHPWVNWIDFSGPFWRSSTIPHQRNLGCRVAEGDVVAFCDAGGEPQVDWLGTITAPLRNGTHALVCGPIFSKRVGVYSVINDANDGDVVASAPSGNLAFLKNVFTQVNGFDERLFYGSDVEFSWRCADAGHPCYQVRGAGMSMDFGSSSLSVRRSWRYGRAFFRSWKLHPERSLRIMKESPERVIYPVWILLGPLSILAARWRKFRWAPFAWIGALGLLLVRNRKAPGTYRIVTDHVVGGASTLNEAARSLLGEVPPVIFFPADETNYLRSLSQALTSLGTPTSLWREPTRSATLNLLLGPLWILILAWRGVKVIHIHWIYKFSPSSGAVLGRLARWWFGVFLSSAQAAGVKIVWTAHNLLPHEAIFDDDLAARKLLVKRSSAVIAMSDHGAQEVAEVLGATNITVIPLGSMELPVSLKGRDRVRRELGIEGRVCFTFFGYLRSYKGIETLIGAAELLGSAVPVVISGSGAPEYVANLTTKVNVANAAGADITFIPRWQSEDELADLLAASDVCVFPFVRIDNTGSALVAQLAGVPIIISDLPSLRHIENSGVMRFDHNDPVHALCEAMSVVAKMDGADLVARGRAAREWTLKTSWPEIANATAAVYASAFIER